MIKRNKINNLKILEEKVNDMEKIGVNPQHRNLSRQCWSRKLNLNSSLKKSLKLLLFVVADAGWRMKKSPLSIFFKFRKTELQYESYQ